MPTTLDPKRKVPWTQKINPIYWFLNDDDQWPEDWYAKDDPYRVLKWYIRNPLSNFTNYVIGISDRRFDPEFHIIGSHPGEVFVPFGQTGWVCNVVCYKWLRLPFVSYRGWCKFYIGFRERGNFGIKLTPNHD